MTHQVDQFVLSINRQLAYPYVSTHLIRTANNNNSLINTKQEAYYSSPLPDHRFLSRTLLGLPGRGGQNPWSPLSAGHLAHILLQMLAASRQSSILHS